MKSVNIFRNAATSDLRPIRVEFWDTDKLVERFNVYEITSELAARIRDFML